MYETFKNLLLKILKVPPEPNDPMGDVKSLRVFRASYNYYRYQFIIWAVKSFFSFASIFVAALLIFAFSFHLPKNFFIPSEFILIIMLLIFAAMFIFAFFKIFISYIMMRLNYEMRWYKVSDRSLRIREGVSRVREITMTFANIQNIYVLQGPVQRFFKIADLKVESAGGGGALVPTREETCNLDMHVAYFRGIDNADEICSLMKERIKVYHDSGLGDTDTPAPPEEHQNPNETEILKEIREECSKFRMSLQGLESFR
ncbi:MAG: hypothetical protein A2017_12335 [Lentisphaerae bacterium GWF2_44_16]|nr:MAG: hypothetical protein A2017_12335 [Lentisphaerae bacterium GWF2_44_16]